MKPGGGSAKAPNPWESAQAQSWFYKQAAREAAKYNQMGVSSPYGRQYYTGDIGSPDRQINIELSPEQQQLLDYQQGLSSQLLGYGTEELAPAMMDRLNAPDSTAVEDAMYQRGLNRFDPQYERSVESTRSRLLGQGIPEGSRAYQQAMAPLEEGRRDYLENLELSSQLAGAQENRAQRQQSMYELSNLLGMVPGQQAPPSMMPPATQMGVPDYMGAQALRYQSELNRDAQKQQALAGLYSTAGNIFGAMMF